MSRNEAVISKEVRPGFTCSLLPDHDPEHPRRWTEPSTHIHFWDNDHRDLSDSQEIASYADAIHTLYQDIYPELIHRCLDDEPPQEILDLIDETPYPGAVLWLNVYPGRSQETSIETSRSPDIENSHLQGVAFITGEQLRERKLDQGEGEAVLQNDVLELEQYVNGNVYVLCVDLEGETEYCGGIYPVARSERSNGKVPLLENTHIPTDELLDECLAGMTSSEEDLILIRSAAWR